MTGAMVIVENGTPLQPLVAMLIQMTFLLIVLKLAPYNDDLDDWSSFVCSLALTLTTLAGFLLMISRKNLDPVLSVDILTTSLIGIGDQHEEQDRWKECNEHGTFKGGERNFTVSCNVSHERLTTPVHVSHRLAHPLVNNEKKEDDDVPVDTTSKNITCQTDRKAALKISTTVNGSNVVSGCQYSRTLNSVATVKAVHESPDDGCVGNNGGRSDYAIMGTPGGDAGEFVLAMCAVEKAREELVR